MATVYPGNNSPATTAPNPVSLKSIQRPGMLLGIPDCSAITSRDTLIGYRRKRRRDAESRIGANVGAAIRLSPQDRTNPSSDWCRDASGAKDCVNYSGSDSRNRYGKSRLRFGIKWGAGNGPIPNLASSLPHRFLPATALPTREHFPYAPESISSLHPLRPRALQTPVRHGPAMSSAI